MKLKNAVYTGLASLIMGCVSHGISVVESPVTVQGRQAVYLETSKGDCYLKLPQSSGTDLRIYDRKCNDTADAAGEVNTTENFLYLKNREQLDAESQGYLDDFLQEAKRNKGLNIQLKANDVWPQDLLR